MDNMVGCDIPLLSFLCFERNKKKVFFFIRSMKHHYGFVFLCKYWEFRLAVLTCFVDCRNSFEYFTKNVS